MSLTYHEYMNEVQQLDARIRENKKKSVELLQQRDAQRVTALKKLEADFHSQKNRLYEECRDDCHRIREEYRAERQKMHLQRETLIYEWRKEHPIPTRVIRKAYELMGMEPGGFLTEAAEDLQSAAAFITPPTAAQETKGGEA